MRDVLEYSVQELESLSTDELKILAREAESKESLYNTKQLVQKTLINSLYGALANKHFPLFNEQMAAAITGNGRYFIRKMAANIEQTLQGLYQQDIPYVLYGDTDSIYLHIKPFMDVYQHKNPDKSINEYVNWADEFEKKAIQPIIQKTIEEFSNELNAHNKNKIGVEREIISDAAVFTAKKKYYARVRDSEGTRYPDNEPKIKVMGLEIIKSSTPKWSQKYLKEAIPSILDKNEKDLRDWVRSIKNEYMNVDLNEIASVGGVKSLDYKLGQKSVPIGSRSALCYNEYIDKNGLEGKYNKIQAGDKTKRLYLIEPNKFNSNIIAFVNENFVQEIDCVDYDTNFYKGFLKPLEIMTAPLNYNLEKETCDIDDW